MSACSVCGGAPSHAVMATCHYCESPVCVDCLVVVPTANGEFRDACPRCNRKWIARVRQRRMARRAVSVGLSWRGMVALGGGVLALVSLPAAVGWIVTVVGILSGMDWLVLGALSGIWAGMAWALVGRIMRAMGRGEKADRMVTGILIGAVGTGGCVIAAGIGMQAIGIVTAMIVSACILIVGTIMGMVVGMLA